MTTHTAVEQFIEDAIAGGAKFSEWKSAEDVLSDWDFDLGLALLRPDVWQAVGKTRGWRTELYENGEVEWQHIWHRFIDHLAEGDTIESALTKLSE